MPTLRDDLVTAEIEKEILVYDPLTAEAHHLNQDAAEVWRACRENSHLEESPQVIDILAVFQDKGFFTKSQVWRSGDPIARRAALSLLGKVALAPAVLTMALPAPTAAMSGTVTQADCDAGVAGNCGLQCTDGMGSPISNRVCGSDGVNPGCACVPPAVAMANPCLCL